MAAEALAAWAHHRHPEAVQHRPRGLLAAKPQRALNTKRRNAVLLSAHRPRRRQPQPQRRARARVRAKVDARRDRRLMPAQRALPPAVIQLPAITARAARPAEALWSAQPLQVVTTSRLIGKPDHELRAGAGIVDPHCRHSPSAAALPDGNGCPVGPKPLPRHVGGGHATPSGPAPAYAPALRVPQGIDSGRGAAW